MRQMSFFDVPPRQPDPPHCGTETSRAAAKAIKPTAGTLRAQVHQFIKSRGDMGATRNEIEVSLSMSGNTVRPRVRELIAAGLIVDTEETRTTPSGRSASVLVAK